MIELLAYILKAIGVVFLLIAAIGVVRLPDAFTRMHAATKAGTLGAGLVVLGAALSTPGVEPIAVTILTVFILVLTVPLASHLLARAAYTSGAPFWRGTKEDDLEDVLPRGGGGGGPATPAHEVQPFRIDRIVVAPTHGSDCRAATQAAEIARTLDKPLACIGMIDPVFFAGSGDDLSLARARLENILVRAEAICEGAIGVVEVEEDDPLKALPRMLRPADLLVLPGEGWFNHGVGREPDSMSGRGERLLPLARRVSVPVLLAGRNVPVSRVTVLDDGGDRIAQAIATLAQHRLFGSAAVTVVAVGGERAIPERRAQIGTLGAQLDLNFSAADTMSGGARTVGEVVVCANLPTSRADRYGMDWRDKIAPGWRGHVLLV